MKWFEKPESQLDEPIEAILEELSQYSPIDPEYERALDKLERIKKLKSDDEKSLLRYRFDPNTLVSAVGTLAAIGLVWTFEEKHVMSSTVKDLFTRPRK